MPRDEPSAWPAFLRDRLEPLPPDLAAEQIEIHSANGLYIRQVLIPKSGTVLPQHVHPTSHLTMVARGRVWVWQGKDGPHPYAAPTGVLVKAGVPHTFMSREDDTLLYCIHSTSDPEMAAFLAAHGLEMT